jgi:putative oxidoreductase
MTTDTGSAGWTKAAVLVGRLISAAIFIVAANFKFYDIDGTVKYIAAAGFPVPKILVWLTALFGEPGGVQILR